MSKIHRQQSIQVEGYKQKREDSKNKLSYQRTVSVNTSITEEKKNVRYHLYTQNKGLEDPDEGPREQVS